MEDGRRLRQIESAGRCLAAALAQTDVNVVAALLRATAKYLETSASGAQESFPARLATRQPGVGSQLRGANS
jgi:hypothetical protein